MTIRQYTAQQKRERLIAIVDNLRMVEAEYPVNTDKKQSMPNYTNDQVAEQLLKATDKRKYKRRLQIESELSCLHGLLSHGVGVEMLSREADKLTIELNGL